MSVAVSCDRQTRRSDEPIVRRLQFYFATLTALGGCVLAVGNQGEMVPLIAIFFAVFGYLFVDTWRLFALPPAAAYVAMAAAAIYCIADFTEGYFVGPPRLLAVANLLVLVQAILMLQRKSKRIFEQLGIFCLLELIVAAVFNYEIGFGLLMIPITVIGALALGLLAASWTLDGMFHKDLNDLPEKSVAADRQDQLTIFTTAGRSADAIARFANQYSVICLAMLSPAIILIAVCFFYALPRTSEAARTNNRGVALIGFSDQVRLEQLGGMLQNPATALRIKLVDRSTGNDFRASGGIYLRGKVLERYQSRREATRHTAMWSAIPVDPKTELARLPREYFPSQNTDANVYQDVGVSIDCASMRSNSLFSIAPYHRLGLNSELVHLRDRWTIARRKSGDWVNPPILYSFGTHAFRQGFQSELIFRPESIARSDRNPNETAIEQPSRSNQSANSYHQELLAFDNRAMPTIAKLAADLARNNDQRALTTYELAKAMEQHLASSGLYRYTLAAAAESIAGLDPIEQFVTTDKQGHCQYYASALTMMLRSQQIPARVVVGYHTDEYSQWNHQYVARQLHAHAWVEALIDGDQLGPQRQAVGHPESLQYWLRLDPTPAAAGRRQQVGTIRQSIDLAQDLWDDYVVEMDADRQQGSVIAGGIPRSGPWFDEAVLWLSRQIRRLTSDNLRGGAVAGGKWFSGSAAVLAVLIVSGIMLLRWRLPKRNRRHELDWKSQRSPRPGIGFYASALDELARLGIERRAGQTPTEFVLMATARTEYPGVPSIRGPMERLTATFYRQRFGSQPQSNDDRQREQIVADLAAVAASVQTMIRIRTAKEITA